MSSKYPIYVVWGLLLPYPENATDDDDFYETLDPFKGSDPKNGTTVILDGMGGEWCAVGHVFAKSDDYAQDLGNHSLPPSPAAGLPAGMLSQYAQWRNGIEATLDELGLRTAALGLAYGWHVVQHFK